MLKTILAAGPIASLEVGDEGWEKGGQGVQVEDQSEKEPAQKSRKSKKIAKSKKKIRAKTIEALRARNLSSQSGAFFTTNARRAFIKLRQALIEAPILNHFDPECHIQIETDALVYAIGGILSQLTTDDSG